MAKFQGVSKRQDILLDTDRLILIEDFAHHPTAIKTTISGIRKNFPTNRLLVAIELRSNTMKSGFHDKRLVEATSDADKIFWKSSDSEQVQGLINKNPSISFKIDDVDVFVNNFNSISDEGDILLVMSNGNFDSLSSKILEITKDE